MNLENTVRILLLLPVLSFGFSQPVHAQEKGGAAPQMIKESGCVEPGVEAGCLVLTGKDKKLYNLFFGSGKKPNVGMAISFEGKPSSAPNFCMQGTAVDVTTWTQIKMHCPADKARAIGGKMEKVYKTSTVQLALLKSKPPQLAITAFGQVRTGGWKKGTLQPRIYVQPPQDGIQDFDFVAEPPAGAATQVISPITAHYVMTSMPAWLKGVRVHSGTNNVEAKLSDATSLEMN